MTRAASTSSVHVVSQSTNASAPLLANIEASWASLPASEQAEVYQALEEVQKKDWKELTVDEKKAGE
jgi:TRAP-type C4-dicarboxylate transport system substrate-binding protein